MFTLMKPRSIRNISPAGESYVRGNMFLVSNGKEIFQERGKEFFQLRGREDFHGFGKESFQETGY